MLRAGLRSSLFLLDMDRRYEFISATSWREHDADKDVSLYFLRFMTLVEHTGADLLITQVAFAAIDHVKVPV